VHGQSHRVKTPFSHAVYIGFGGKTFQPGIVKALHIFFTREFLEFCAEITLIDGSAVQLEHIRFLQHPSAETHAAQNNFAALSVFDRLAIYAQKAL